MQEAAMKNLDNVDRVTIGVLAKRTGFNVSAIRYYEEVGLIPPAARRPSGHRVYSEKEHGALALIKRCREFGFSIEETRALVALADEAGKDCVEARDIAQAHLDAVRVKLAELAALEQSLAKFVNACTEQCAGGPAPKCTILTDMSLRDAGGAPARGCCG
jgi:DNA-binding transcriptional MerR regulator